MANNHVATEKFSVFNNGNNLVHSVRCEDLQFNSEVDQTHNIQTSSNIEKKHVNIETSISSTTKDNNYKVPLNQPPDILFHPTFLDFDERFYILYLFFNNSIDLYVYQL